MTLPNERLDSQHDEGQFSECYLGAAEGNLDSDVFTILTMGSDSPQLPTAARQWHSGLGFGKVKALTSNILCLSVFDIRLTQRSLVRLLDLVFGEALGQAVKDDTPACR